MAFSFARFRYATGCVFVVWESSNAVTYKKYRIFQ